MKISAKKSVDAVQFTGASLPDLMALGGEAVHMGFTQDEEAGEQPHLSNAEGNVCIQPGEWLVGDNGTLSVMTDAEFKAQYNAG